MFLSEATLGVALEGEGTGAQSQEGDDGVDLDHVDGELCLL